MEEINAMARFCVLNFGINFYICRYEVTAFAKKKTDVCILSPVCTQFSFGVFQ